MNILYIVQQSVYTNNNKWVLADSNVQIMRGIISELLKETDWKFYVLIGRLGDFYDVCSYDELINSERVHFIPYNFPVDAFLSRQHFNITEFDDCLKKLPKIDIIWNNITELSRNIKTYLVYRKYETKLITCCYWLDAPMIGGQSKVNPVVAYDWRQFDGFECSDLCVFTCESTLDAWKENARLRGFNAQSVKTIVNKSTIWDFGFSSEELLAHRGNTRESRFDFGNRKAILFLNRLSGINYTHHLEFIKAIQMLRKLRDDFCVVVANPSAKVSWNWLKENIPNLFVPFERTLTRNEYIDLLWSGRISVHLFDSELYGGCAHRESLFCGNVVVTPKINEYLRIQGEEYPFYTTPPYDDLTAILDWALSSIDDLTLLDLIPVEKWELIQSRNEKSSFETVAALVINDIEQRLTKQ